MRVLKKREGKDKISETVSSRIKNPDLVRKKHLLIAKKATKLFIKKGFQQTTMREISKATGMAIGNLYDYISKKEDVLCLVFDVYHQYVEDKYLENQDTLMTEDPIAQLKAYIHYALHNVETFRDEILLMYRESKLLPKENLERAKRKELEQIETLAIIIRKGVEKGIFQVKDPFFAASMVFYQLIFSTLRGWIFRGNYSEEEVNQLIEDYVLKPYIS